MTAYAAPRSTSSSTARPRCRSSSRWTRALELNGRGPARLLRALREAGSDPYFVHVSTAYAAGQRTGLVLERPSGSAPAEPHLDLDAELAAAQAWRRDIEAESRLPVHQQRFVRDARREVGPAGGPAIGARAEALRHGWVYAQLCERGRERSRALGWTDGYTLSKALGERLLLAEDPRALTIVRPAIVESALRTPYPGWLEDLKVADPILLAYGAGLIGGRFPANRSVRIDIVPVDLVANACVAAAAHEPVAGVRTCNIVSGSRNPLTVDVLAGLVTEYFRERPLPGEDGLPVEVPEWRLVPQAARAGGARPGRAAARRRPRPGREGAAAAQRRPRAAAAQGPSAGSTACAGCPRSTGPTWRSTACSTTGPRPSCARRWTRRTASGSASTWPTSTGRTTCARSTCPRCAS